MKKPLLFVVVLLFIAACTQNQQIDTEKMITDDVEDEAEDLMEDTDDAMKETVDAEYDEEIAALLDKGVGRTKYHYIFNMKERDDFGNYIVKENYEVFVRDDKVKKSFAVPVKRTNQFFQDMVYMDNAAKTALATCAKGGILCRDEFERVYTTDYEKNKLPFTVIDLLKDIPADAKVVGSRALYGRSTTIIEYETSDLQRIYVDGFLGLPLKHQVYEIHGDEEVILKESTFQRMSVAVKNSDVNVPSDFVFVS